MTTLSEDFRVKAAENVTGSTTLFAAPDFATDPKKQTMAVIGQVNATIYSALADMMDVEHLSAGVDAAMERRRAILKRNDAVRMAAARGSATGDWNEFDKLVAGESTNGTGAGTSGTTGGA